MKTQNLLLTGILLLVSVASLSAQNTLPNPHDDSCWSSLSALRACQIQVYDQAQAHAQDCTSYPEYQCFDYYQPQASAKTTKKADHQAADVTPVAASAPVVTPDTNTLTTGTN